MASVLLTHAVRDNHIPKPDFQPTLAFDKLQQPTIGVHLASSDPRVVAAALVSLLRILSSHLSAAAAYESGVIASLGFIARAYLAGGDPTVVLPIRRDAMRCITLALASPSRRVEFLAVPEVVSALRDTISDNDSTLRELTATAISSAASGHDACNALTELGFVGVLVTQLRAECVPLPGSKQQPLEARGSEASTISQLRALVAILSQPGNGAAVAGCMAAGAEDTLAQVLTAVFGGSAVANPERLSLALQVLAHIAFDAAGRETCASHPSLIRTIVALTAAGAPEVSRQALCCVMVRPCPALPPLLCPIPTSALSLQALSTSDLAKRRVTEDAGGLPALVRALRAAPEPSAAVFAANAIAGLSPYPPARAGLLASKAHEAARDTAGRFKGNKAVERACGAAAAAVSWAA